MNTEPLLSIRGLCKRFPGVDALRQVDLDLRPGEVHALMGQNGAGKSTLVKIITGVHAADAGIVTLGGLPFRPASPAAAQAAGVAAIYQEINLVHTLSVAENLCLGRFRRRWYGIDWRDARRRARALLDRFQLQVDVNATVASLSAAVRQMLCIIRAVEADARLLVLDEPTSSLDPGEVRRLFELLHKLRAGGAGILYITHFIDEVFRMADRTTVLRNGERVGTFDTAALSRRALVEHMLGRSIGAAAPAARRPAEVAPLEQEAAPLLRAIGLARRGAVEPFDLQLRRGEVVGLAGLLGSGRTEAARLVFGADRADRGSIEIDGRPAAIRSPRAAIALGIGLCPEDRRVEGIVPDMSIRDNIVLVVQRRLGRLGWVPRRLHRKMADEFARRLGIVAPDLDAPIRNLSGGNQQKAILARWLACSPRILILDEPMRGIDVGAKRDIAALIDELAAAGLAVLFISSELGEVADRCHRAEVLRDHRWIGSIGANELSEQTILRMIAGEEEAGP